MKILADKNILCVENGFSQYGELKLIDGRNVQAEDLRDADVLLVRSVTKVDAALLDGSNIKFVGTATSGTDHIDQQYLRENNIVFADAKGSNANAVVDYCFAALAHEYLAGKLKLKNCVIGIVGGGKVGSLFASKLAALGFDYRLCDPLLALQQTQQENEEAFSYCELDEVLQCDVVSLHVPLTDSGAFPTRHLLDEQKLRLMKSGALLLHSCRGGVVDERALRQLKREGQELNCVFDVWQGEPEIDLATAQMVDIATPHIAGYSQEAKTAATECLRQAFLQHFDLNPEASSDNTIGASKLMVEAVGDGENKHWQVLLEAFPIEQLSLRFKQAIADGVGKAAFDNMRQQLLQRREFKAMAVDVKDYSLEQKNFLSVLGFNKH